MSSKSRKHSSKGGPKGQHPSSHAAHGGQHPHGHHGGRADHGHAEGDHADPTVEDFLEAEEILKTPKGKSPLLFGFLVLLLIFLLIVFVAGDAFYASQRGGGRGRTVMRWTHPTEGPLEVSALDFKLTAEKLDFAPTRTSRVEDEQVAQFIILDRLTRDAGVRVGTAELRQRLQQAVEQFGSVDAYKAVFARFPGSVAGFEAFIQDQLSIQRMQALLRSFASVPDVEQLQRSWADQRQLYTFDLAQVEVAGFRDQALAETPDDATLQAWLDGRSDFQRREYEQPAARRIELLGALFGDPERSFEALLAAYPEVEETDPETRAREYYERSFFTRFKRDEPIPADAEDAPEDPTARLYLPFEEVRDQAEAESAVYGALQRFRADLDARIAAGEAVDLVAEAERLGLDLQAPGEPVTQAELREMEGLGGLYIAGPLFGLQEVDAVTAGVSIGADGLTIGRVREIVPASMPPAAEIRDQLLDPWAAERALELATERLEALRAELAAQAAAEGPVEEGADETGLTVDHDTFAAAVEAAGLTVERITDYDRTDRPEDPTPIQSFLRTSFVPFTLEPGGVDEVRKAFDGERVYLVRLDDTRDPDLSMMTTSDFQRLLQQPQMPADDPFSVERLRERYGLWLETDERRGPEDGEPSQP